MMQRGPPPSWPSGEVNESILHARQALTRYGSDRDRTALAFVGENAFVTSQHWAAFSLWFTGYPDTALRHSQAAVRMARRPDYAFSLCMALEQAASRSGFQSLPARCRRWPSRVACPTVRQRLEYFWDGHAVS